MRLSPGGSGGGSGGGRGHSSGGGSGGIEGDGGGGGSEGSENDFDKSMSLNLFVRPLHYSGGSETFAQDLEHDLAMEQSMTLKDVFEGTSSNVVVAKHSSGSKGGSSGQNATMPLTEEEDEDIEEEKKEEKNRGGVFMLVMGLLAAPIYILYQKVFKKSNDADMELPTHIEPPANPQPPAAQVDQNTLINFSQQVAQESTRQQQMGLVAQESSRMVAQESSRHLGAAFIVPQPQQAAISQQLLQQVAVCAAQNAAVSVASGATSLAAPAAAAGMSMGAKVVAIGIILSLATATGMSLVDTEDDESMSNRRSLNATMAPTPGGNGNSLIVPPSNWTDVNGVGNAGDERGGNGNWGGGRPDEENENDEDEDVPTLSPAPTPAASTAAPTTPTAAPTPVLTIQPSKPLCTQPDIEERLACRHSQSLDDHHTSAPSPLGSSRDSSGVNVQTLKAHPP